MEVMDNDCSQLVGRWMTDPDDLEGLEAYGQATLVFGADGSLTYVTHSITKDEITILTYRVEDGCLITDQMSEPKIERTPFILTSDGKLILQYDQVRSSYVRQEVLDSRPRN